MKILFFSRSFYPNIGGVEKHVMEVSTRLVTSGHRVTVITERLSNPGFRNNDSNVNFKGIDIIRINSGKEDWFKKFRVWKELSKEIKLIKSADIVHCHDVFYWWIPFIFLFPNKKVFVTFHGYEGDSLPSFKAKLMHKISEKLTRGNICVGNFLKKWYGTSPTFVTYGAVSQSLIEKGSKRIFNKKNNSMAFVGRLENETGILTYLDALRIYSEKEKNISLDIYGDGVLMKEIEAYIRKNNLNVRLFGFVKDIDPVLVNYEKVFCSRYLSILESLALRQEVFSHYNNAIKKDYLLMAPFSRYINIFSSSTELVKLLNSSKPDNKKKGYEWVKSKTWEYMAELYLSLWNK
jgi:glycosyltransferase involved in cell wall biosynthesis